MPLIPLIPDDRPAARGASSAVVVDAGMTCRRSPRHDIDHPLRG